MAKRRSNRGGRSVRSSKRSGYRTGRRVSSKRSSGRTGHQTVRIVVETGNPQPGGQTVTPEALKASFMSPVGRKSTKGMFT